MTTEGLMDHIARTPVIPDSLAIWGMGQMGAAVKGPDAVAFFDLCLSNIVEEVSGSWWSRAYPPPALPETLRGHFTFITHEHLDHLDTQTVKPLAQANPEMRFIAPGWCRQILLDLGIASERIIIPQALAPMTLPGTSLRFTAIPAAHYEKEYDEEKGYRWFGYIVEWNGVTFYHAGDTIMFPDYVHMLAMLPKADVALIPVNGRDYYRETDANATGNLLPFEAARLCLDAGWDLVIPGHNDLYPNNTIPFSEIVHALNTVSPRQKYKILQPGELLYYVKANG
ncbi:MAG: MBL fold metallo-hydrolase [bacterium]|nr:MBL fold metallo-hydrolase [bacterium]